MTQVIHADVLDGLAGLPAETFHCVVTSPPYWMLRSYAGVAPTAWADGMTCLLGMEPDPDTFVRHLVQVFDGVKRVLRTDGVCFVNLGETYADDTKWGGATGGKHVEGLHGQTGINRERKASGLKPGDRCGIPERFALAMQAAGWWWRDTIIWHKRSPMPSSQSGWRWMRCRVKVASGAFGKYAPRGTIETATPLDFKDANRLAQWSPCPGCAKCSKSGGYVLKRGRFRTTAAHEPIFMFVRGSAYFCDDQAASEPVADPARSGSGNKAKRWGNNHTDVRANGTGEVERQSGIPWQNCETRLPRSVWSLSSEPSKEKHFAAYPTTIPRRCIEMATSKAGCCPTCGACWAPVVESVRVPTRPGETTKVNGDRAHEGNRDPERHVSTTSVFGYRATCACPPAESVPCRVLDPFAGTGTTLQVANALGRDWVGIEASADYLEICERRALTPLPQKKLPRKNGKPRLKSHPAQKALFQ